MKIMKLKNKFALVTGTSTGIGRAIATEFAKETGRDSAPKVFVMEKGGNDTILSFYFVLK